jgi:amidase
MNPGRLRIAFTTTAITGMPVHHDCVRAVHAAADLCSDLGHLVIEAAPDIDAEILVNSFTVVWSVGCASMVDRAAILTRQELAPERFEELTWEMIQHARRMTGPDYLAAVNVLQRTARQVGRFFTEFDVWLTPTLAEPPLPVGSFEVPGKPLFGFERAVAFAPFTPIANLTGQPAMSVPLFWNQDGLPIGTHFVGRFGDEALLFRLAAQLETARPWIDRYKANVPKD